MKRRIIAVLLCAAVPAVSACSKDGAKPYRIGLVNFVTGKVSVTGAGGKVFPAQIGLPVDEGMTIRTEGKGSLCELYIKDTAVKIFADSSVDISRLGYSRENGGERTAMNLQSGTLFVRVAKKLSREDRFIVRTPTLVASVRGTEFFMTKKDLSCLDGKMEVKSSHDKAPVVVEDGETAQALSGKSSKKKTDASSAKRLAKDADVKPVEKMNSDLFDKLDSGDAPALKNLKARVKAMSGRDVKKEKKEDKHDIDIFFFKS